MKGKTMTKGIPEKRIKYRRVLALLLSLLLVLGSTVQTEAAVSGTAVNGTTVSGTASSAEESRTVSILLIGNSYTKYNNMPTMLRKICTSMGKKVKVTCVAKSKASLSDFASRSTYVGKRVHSLLKRQSWDYVILQDRHYYSLTNVSGMLKAVRALQPYISAAGAKMALYMTWAPEKGHSDYKTYKKLVSGKTEYQRRIKRAYEYVAHKTGAMVIPVGLAFETAGNQSSLKLIGTDKSHPTKYGSYLAACSIYASLFGESPEGASAAGVKKSAAKKLQRLSWKTCRSYTGEASGISQFY